MKSIIFAGISVVSTGFAIYKGIQNKKLGTKNEYLNDLVTAHETEREREPLCIRFAVRNHAFLVEQNAPKFLGKLLSKVASNTPLLEGTVAETVAREIKQALDVTNDARRTEGKVEIKYFLSHRGLEFKLWIDNPEELVKCEVENEMSAAFRVAGVEID